MIRPLLLLYLVAVGLMSSAQLPSDTLRVENINMELVERLFLAELNKQRHAHGLSDLQTDELLRKAAVDQANYCSKTASVTHYQEGNARKYDVSNRVKFYGGSYFKVGENCLMTVLFQPIPNPKTKTNTVIFTYAQLAHQLFENWKSSPPHYKNMMERGFLRAGLAVSMYSNGRVLYAAQVFGSDPYTPIKNGLKYTDTTYRIAETVPGKCKNYGENDYLASIFSSYVVLLGDSIFQYYQKQNTVADILQNNTDGLAVDLVYKEQFKCFEPDILHPSTVFDGYLLPPKFRRELFQNDLYANDEFLSYLGKIPPEAPRKNLQLNVVMIQNGMACRYSTPVAVEQGVLPDINIRPQWCIADGIIPAGVADFVREFDIPFSKNFQRTDSFYFRELQQLIKVYGKAVTLVEIDAYSSIEGSEAGNILLQNNRAQFIATSIRKELSEEQPIKMNAAENWPEFYRQWQPEELLTSFADTTKEGIRNTINKTMNSPEVAGRLDKQRVAKVRIHVHLEYDNASPHYTMPIVLADALARGDSTTATVALSRMVKAYQNGKLPAYYLTATQVPLQRVYLPLVSNYLASLVLSQSELGRAYYNPALLSYADSAANLFRDFVPLRFNLMLYKLQQYWAGTLYNPSVYKKMEMDLLQFGKEKLVDTICHNSMMYNYYLTGSLLYREQRLYSDMYYAFESVKPYLRLIDYTEKEMVDIVRYYNYFVRFGESIILLEPAIDKFPNSEELTFLYVSIGAIYNLNIDYHTKFYHEMIDKMATMNRQRLCEWINENYQLLRIPAIKQQLCSYCKLEY